VIARAPTPGAGGTASPAHSATMQPRDTAEVRQRTPQPRPPCTPARPACAGFALPPPATACTARTTRKPAAGCYRRPPRWAATWRAVTPPAPRARRRGRIRCSAATRGTPSWRAAGRRGRLTWQQGRAGRTAPRPLSSGAPPPRRR